MSTDDDGKVVILFPKRKKDKTKTFAEHIKPTEETYSEYKTDSHYCAMMNPLLSESPIVYMYQGLILYVRIFADDNGSPLGDCEKYSAPWRNMAASFFELLSGNIGRLDAAQMKAAIKKIAEMHNINLYLE